MQDQQEREFIDFWQKVRDRRRSLRYQILYGIPFGGLFALPIMLNFILGRIWYRRADAVAVSQFNPLVLIIAVLIISVIGGWLIKRFQWERNEDRYRELMSKLNKKQ